MKTFVSVAALTVFALVSASAMAEGSKIEKSTIINASSNTNALNAAIGENASANVGSVDIK